MSRQLLTRNDRVAQMTKQEELIAKKKREILEKQKNAEIAKTIAANMSSSNSIATTTNNLCSGNNCSSIQDIITSNDDTFDNTTNEIVTGTDTTASLSTTMGTETATSITPAPISVATSITATPIVTASSTCTPAIRNTFSNDGSFMEKFKKFAEAALSINHLVDGSSEMNESGSNADDSNIVEQKTFIQPTDMNNQKYINCPVAAFTTNSVGFAQMPALISSECPAYNTTVNLLSNNNNISNIPSLINSNEINLNTIPQPKPLSLNEIPPPKELDLNAIPKPELNLDAIKIPVQQNQQQSLVGLSLLSQIKEEVCNSNVMPTTLDQLIDTVAECGDEFENTIISLKNDIPPSLWFLFSKESETYKVYRENVQMKRQQMVVDKKYDPSEIYHEKDDDGCNDSDSDYEFMKEAKERNLRNIKRKITNRRNDDEYYTSDSDDDDERFWRYSKNRDDFLDKCTGIADGAEGGRGGAGGAGGHGTESSDSKSSNRSKIKKSRWGDKVIDLGINEQNSSLVGITHTQNIVLGEQIKPLLMNVTRTDPALLQYARQNFGTIDLSEEDWRKAEEHYKIYLLYQDMLKKRDEIDRLAKTGKFKYEYDSDEDTTGGTWEHKLRSAEMKATEIWAEALNKQSEGKHHIGDFLPPEELKKFMEKYNAKKNNREPDLSDYKEYKLTEDNIGFQMLQKLGWKEGQGLGAGGSGIVDPINKASRGESNQGLGASALINPNEEDNEYDAYRKRMMLAYRFRPNPLNNPRRAYY